MPSEPPPEKPKRRWRTALGIGCAVFIWLAIADGIYKAVTEPDVPPATEQAAAVAAPAPTVQDTVVSPLPAALSAPAVPAPAPVPPPVEETPPPVAKAQKSITVYTTRTGSKYHRSSCSSLRKSREATTLSEAQSWGYEPCGRCKPPR